MLVAQGAGDWTRAATTIVMSDFHLADAYEPPSGNPYWKLFKSKRFYADESFSRLLDHLMEHLATPIELVLAGDFLDFDSVMALPTHRLTTSWLERRRGLAPTEEKSRFKLRCIMDAHRLLFDALGRFVSAGNRVVFVIGNHDMELHWPKVQADIERDIAADCDPEHSLVGFAEWFYISNGDTLIEHGNQYDPYCLCSNPIKPFIVKGVDVKIGPLDMSERVLVRQSFGNLAGKYMTNGMGLMNPHAVESFIKTSATEYARFFYRYMLKAHPALPFTWLWGAIVTLFISLREGFMAPYLPPEREQGRVGAIALRSNATPEIVSTLKEIHAHPAIFSPIKIMRELWLDRAFLLILILYGSYQIFAFYGLIASAQLKWFFVPLIVLLPFFLFYARKVRSEVDEMQRIARSKVPISARIAGVGRVVHGHTHNEEQGVIEGVEYLNCGSWSPAFTDVECTQPVGRKCFVEITTKESGARSALLKEWDGTNERQIEARGCP